MADIPGSRESATPARRQPDTPIALTNEAIQWLAGLPAEIKPAVLPKDYARIINALSGRWGIPAECIGYFDELLIDRRGTRHGFPMSVALELARLKNYYESEVHPTQQTWWDHLAV